MKKSMTIITTLLLSLGVSASTFAWHRSTYHDYYNRWGGHTYVKQTRWCGGSYCGHDTTVRHYNNWHPHYYRHYYRHYPHRYYNHTRISFWF